MVFMTDHAEWFDDASIKAYVEECEKLSDNDFAFVAGLEFECERKMHILGYGVTELATANIGDFKDFGFERVWNPLKETASQ